MAIVAPFRAYCYDSTKVGGLDRVVTQPYDKITPEMQQDYFARSPYNLARIIRGETNSADTLMDNVYTRAANYFRNWREAGVLQQRPRPALYAYFQEFCVPGSAAGTRMVRKGFIGLGKLEEYSSGVIFRHEQTLSAPKADRLDLLRATRGHFGQIFMLYSDPQRAIDALLDQAASGPPFARVNDEYGTVHTVWEITEPNRIEAIRELMRERKLIIADGHHRYETALNFQRECRAAGKHEGSEDCSYAMMTFVNMEAPGIAILPTHRLVSGVEDFTRSGFLSRAARYFSSREYAFATDLERRAVGQKLRADMADLAGKGRSAVGAIFAGYDAFYLLELRDTSQHDPVLAELTPAERTLDVNVLHRIAFGLCLGMDEESVRKEKFLTYVRDFEEGTEKVLGKSAQACFFLNPVKIQQVKEIALGGRFLPQKTTDFYPKLLSGLAIYRVNS